MKLRDLSQGLKELGLRGAAFRASWEIQGRIGLGRVNTRTPIDARPYTANAGVRDLNWCRNIPFPDAPSVAEAIRPLLTASELQTLRDGAYAALRGKIRCFSHHTLDFGSPIDWHLQPQTGAHWDRSKDIIFSIGNESREGDVKFSWEAARFPQAYLITRASAFFPEEADGLADGLLGQIESFIASNPFGFGVHWTSGQEISFRILAWLFALDVLFSRTRHAARAERVIAEAMISAASWIEAHLDYSRIAVYNNHLLSEAVALFGVGALLPLSANGPEWRRLGRHILNEESERQFYPDGAYIQQSHNYHRVALQDLLWACAFARAMGDRPSPIWTAAIERSIDFLVAHQNPADGRLPNYGANDGSYPSILTGCAFGDMRPTLQSASLLVRNERLYEPGPWDEAAAWWLGPMALDAPQRDFTRRSVSFGGSGYHVLRGTDQSSFAAFRCGSLRDRFSQIDMLHLDVWWRGMNVLVDGGSYQYNAAPEWHNHFMRTESHNTVVVDGREQMLHFRQFKLLYWTKAVVTRFEDQPRWSVVTGEHQGYERHPGRCIHRRSVLFLKNDVWLVLDTIMGNGDHAARLHWLGGEYPWTPRPGMDGMTLQTQVGDFHLRVMDREGRPLKGDVISGQTNPPRGWLSRHYGHKIAVASYAVELKGKAPMTFVSVLSGIECQVSLTAKSMVLETPQLKATAQIRDSAFIDISVVEGGASATRRH